MFGWFNQKSTYKKALQIYNLAALGLATYDFFFNPESQYSEVGLDIAVHAMSFLSLQENSNAVLQFFSSWANMYRGGAIYAGVTSGCTRVPGVLNGLDALGHAANGFSIVCSDVEEESNESVAKLKN
ncbi:hypothetical protein [Legionella waltersii]|uniref:Uncharacterized protein n=1 Tax=Legionella waltersii TaxID=66969 RepID=A0A0W1ALF9_9GAMM|nr:hypothetical protein [Legionella waltersii]KTD82186.1 hypothetical protein Lwal_0663 [Legionella waltersii]SNV10580.1 Uncharacterised protein [Legionella waltersii]